MSKGVKIASAKPRKGGKLPKNVRAAIEARQLGLIMPFAGPLSRGTNAATLDSEGWLPCDGREVPRNGTYKPLYDVIGDYWGPGDGVTTFNLPDLHGQFLRGVAHGVANDPDLGTRVPRIPNNPPDSFRDQVGSYQAAAVQDHVHEYATTANGPTYDNPNNSASNNPPRYGEIGDRFTSSVVGGSARETRPRNSYVEWVIKAKVGT